MLTDEECFKEHYKFSEFVFLRAPIHPVEKYQYGGIESILKDRVFQLAVWNASRSLYDALKKKGFEFLYLSEKEKISVQKYFNRICHRPTPFGLFATVSALKWRDKGGPIVNEGEPILYSALDFREAVKCYEHNKQDCASDDLYYINPSLYQAGDSIRFLGYGLEESKRQFYLSAVANNYFIKSLIYFFSRPRAYNEAISFLVEQDPKENAEEMLECLINEHIILSNSQPNISGENYFRRLSSRISDINNPCISVSTIDDLVAIVGTGDCDASLSIIATRKFKNDVGLDKNYKEAIIEGLAANMILAGHRDDSGVEVFANKFIKKFDQQCIPLMEALDPEIGIGYGDLARINEDYPLIEDIHFKEQNKRLSVELKWNDRHVLLINKWLTGRKGKLTLQVSKEELSSLCLEEGILFNELPPSISVIFRICEGNKVYIEAVGGPSAISIIGRFTPADKCTLNAANFIAQSEADTNPDVIFAEILNIDDYRTANIEQRNNIRKFEIPILTASLLPVENQIQLSDLWVQVIDREVVLWSKRLRKRIIPRLSSAYNYSRSNLSVFRFLCDLQYQGLKVPRIFSLSGYFPDMNFYPRVEVGEAILQLAEWHIGEDTRKEYVSQIKNEQYLAENMRVFLNNMDIPNVFAFSKADQQLIFYKERDPDMLLFAEILKNEANIVIKEHPFLDIAEKLFIDGAGNRFLPQFIAQLFSKNTIYNSDYKVPCFHKKNIQNRDFLPGSDCLYVKIYCHPKYSNELIGDFIFSWVNDLERNSSIYKWFFIRYNDPSYHIRLRLFCNPNLQRNLLQKLNKHLSLLYKSGYVSDITISVYNREVERYGSKQIGAIEQLFCECSKIVSSFISKGNTEPCERKYYGLSFSYIELLTTAAGFSLLAKIEFHKSMYEQLCKRIQACSKLYQSLQKRYREWRQYLDELNVIDNNQYAFFMKDFIKSLKHVELNISLIADIIHMHINRITVSDALHHETTIHYFLWKYNLSKQKKNELSSCALKVAL